MSVESFPPEPLLTTAELFGDQCPDFSSEQYRARQIFDESISTYDCSIDSPARVEPLSVEEEEVLLDVSKVLCMNARAIAVVQSHLDDLKKNHQDLINSKLDSLSRIEDRVLDTNAVKVV